MFLYCSNIQAMQDPAALARARAMRRNPSATETLLWRLLRDRRLNGLKFRRQVPVGPYFADFACVTYRLIVETDGPHHDSRRDAERDAALGDLGWRVLRFPNKMVWDRRQEVLDQIASIGLRRPSGLPPPAPSAS